jgi:MerR family transcriptional regulator, light-induced transcriptional regulator
MDESAQLRIGELARRTGVAAELLRAWERRYGLLTPTRSSGGYRLYSSDDVLRVGRMRQLLASGLSAAEAARATLASPAPAATPAAPADAGADLRTALDDLDDAEAHAAFDRLLAEFSVGSVLENVVLPVLRDLGEGWARGRVSVAQEHFASNVVRGRLLGLARGWDRGSGPRAVLACPAGERHDLGLLAFGLSLREHGWRITFLGGDTPAETLARTVADLAPAAVVLAAADAVPLEASADSLRELSGTAAVWIGGAGAREDLVTRAGARLLEGSPVAAAERVATRSA